ncbi:MAG: NAD(P)/FAD-dependent oxidoreductase [Magnetovibrionaceae bacterium]
MPKTPENRSVVVIGAGPAGTVAAALLAKNGVDVLVLEKLVFPRFQIGESLLPQSMTFLKKSGLLDAVTASGFQHKDGAAFLCGKTRSVIDFSQKSAEGWGTTYQVKRAEFDHLLAQEAAKAGVEVRQGQSVLEVDLEQTPSQLTVKDDATGEAYQVTCEFVIDASGYGRVLPRLLDLERPSDFPVRTALFTHIDDRLAGKDFDRDKILITVHPQHQDIWYWLIPFSDGTSSLGVVVTPEKLETYSGSPSEKLWTLVHEGGDLSFLLAEATERRDVGTLSGYSTDVSRLCSDRFALLGNAGEFLDPVFSSGVTIALKSADLVVEPLLRQLRGETVDWQAEYAAPLQVGVRCFKAFVESWYSGELQRIIFNPPAGDNPIKNMIISILAGYAWDESNPFVHQGPKYLNLVSGQCD